MSNPVAGFFDDDADIDVGQLLSDEDEHQPPAGYVAPKSSAPQEETFELEVVKDPVRDKQGWKTDPVKTATEVDPAEYSKRVGKTIGKLKASLTETGRQRDLEAQRAAEAIAYARAQQKRIADLEAALQSGAVRGKAQEAETYDQIATLANNEFKAALVSGDANVIATAQQKATQASVKAEAARTEAERLKSAPAPKTAIVPEPVQQQAPATPKARQEWYDKNDWFDVGDGRGANEASRYALKVEAQLRADGIIGDSPAYFRAIDKAVRQKFPEQFADEERPVPVTAAAPRVREQQPNGTPVGKVKFSQDQIEVAVRIGLYNPNLPKDHPKNVKGMKAYWESIQDQGRKG